MNVKALKDTILSHNIAKIKDPKKNELRNLLNSIEEFKKNSNLFDNLDIYQKDVVLCDLEYNIRVIAAAGSGKTTTIISRIKFLVNNGIPPSRIILCAFNVAAAKDMKSRIIKVFGFMPNLIVGTIDSIACKFYNLYFKQNYYISVNEYTSELLKYLKGPHGINIINNYDYFFFDEFQDVNEVQYLILKTFYDRGCKIVVIGDDSQNIYNFRGSDVKYMIDFDKDIDNLKTFKLLFNYRSTPEIVNFANISILCNKNQIKKEMIATKHSIFIKPVVEYFQSSSRENRTIVSRVLYHIKNGVELKDIAIISRNSRSLKKVETFLEKYNSSNKNKIDYVSMLSEQTKVILNKVCLTTIHKSKGLEYDVVFLLGCDDKTIPSNKDDQSIEEERRLFYVAITRAKTYLYLYFKQTLRASEDSKGVPIPPIKPSLTRFIQEIPPTYYKFINYSQDFFTKSYQNVIVVECCAQKIIAAFQQTEIAHLRGEKIIPDFNVECKQIYPAINCKIDKEIENNNWISDYAEFIKYIIRKKIINQYKIKYTDKYAINVIYPFVLDKKKYDMYINRMNSIDVDILSKIDKDIDDMAKKYNISKKSIKVTLKKYLTAHQNNMFKNSYNKYVDSNVSVDCSLEDIYNVSLCSSIFYERKRLIYNSQSKKYFMNNIKDICDLINRYIDYFDYENNKNAEYDVVKQINSTILDNLEIIYCDIDIITNNTLVLFKYSSTDSFKLEWALELIACCYISNFSGSTLEVFDIVQGKVYTFNRADLNIDKVGEDSYENSKKIFMDFLYLSRNKVHSVEKLNNSTLLTNIDTSKESDSMIKSINIDNLDNIINNINSNEGINIEENSALDSRQALQDYFDKNKKIMRDPNTLYKISKVLDFKYLIFDTETTGLPEQINFTTFRKYSNLKAYENARLIQLCWAVYNSDDSLEDIKDFYVKPVGFKIQNTHIHGITHQIADKGYTIKYVLDKFMKVLIREDIKYIVCHNTAFDINIILSELYRITRKEYDIFSNKQIVCTLIHARKMKDQGLISNAKLGTVFNHFFGNDMENAHNAQYDVLNTGKIFSKMRESGIVVLG